MTMKAARITKVYSHEGQTVLDVEFEYDVDRMYGHLNNELFTYVQFATFDDITLPKSYFVLQK